ncbi:hypothetical protein NBO_476g0004, partial [Nosema bombycis CQ1]
MESNDSDEIVFISKHGENLTKDTVNDSDIECAVVGTSNTSKFPKRKAAVTKKSTPKKTKKKETTNKKVNVKKQTKNLKAEDKITSETVDTVNDNKTSLPLGSNTTVETEGIKDDLQPKDKIATNTNELVKETGLQSEILTTTNVPKPVKISSNPLPEVNPIVKELVPVREASTQSEATSLIKEEKGNSQSVITDFEVKNLKTTKSDFTAVNKTDLQSTKKEKPKVVITTVNKDAVKETIPKLETKKTPKTASTVLPKVKPEILKKTKSKVENKAQAKAVPIVIKPEAVKKNHVICRDGENEKIFYLDYNDILEPLFENLSNEAKIKYKGIYVSKFLTLEDLNFTKDENVFEVVGNKKRMLNIKINLDFNRSTSLHVPEEMLVCDLFKLFDSMPDKENKLVINGYLLDETKLLRDIIEDEDVLDYV